MAASRPPPSSRNRSRSAAQLWLQADPDDTDRYLRYVWLDRGRMVNWLIVRRGYAEAVLYEPNDLHWDRTAPGSLEARLI
jgi:endonuclease YncB( thermonuclease family)